MTVIFIQKSLQILSRLSNEFIQPKIYAFLKKDFFKSKYVPPNLVHESWFDYKIIVHCKV